MRPSGSLPLAALLLAALAAGCADSHDGDFARVVALDVAPGPGTPGPAVAAPTDTGVCVLQLAVTAGPDEDVKISSIRFREYGTALPQSAISTVGLYVDADADGAYTPAADLPALATLAAGYAADGTATLAAIDRVVPAGATERWILVYDLSGTGAVGQTFIPSLDGPADVVATGAFSDRVATLGGLPVTGSTLTLLNIGSLSLAPGPAPPPPPPCPTRPAPSPSSRSASRPDPTRTWTSPPSPSLSAAPETPTPTSPSSPSTATPTTPAPSPPATCPSAPPPPPPAAP